MVLHVTCFERQQVFDIQNNVFPPHVLLSTIHNLFFATLEHICTQHTPGRVEMVFLIVLDLISLAGITGTQIRYEHCICIFISLHSVLELL